MPQINASISDHAFAKLSALCEESMMTFGEYVEDQLSLNSVLTDWVQRRTLMQQAVLLAVVRNADGLAKHHPQKELIKWFRRCVLKGAFEGRQMWTPDEPGGGSFTGPVADINKALDEFIWARDEMTLHYFLHTAHAFQILGYHYPDEKTRLFWFSAYSRMCHACHMELESKHDMDLRLSDSPAEWMAREDCAGGCTRTERVAHIKDAIARDEPAIALNFPQPTQYQFFAWFDVDNTGWISDNFNHIRGDNGYSEIWSVSIDEAINTLALNGSEHMVYLTPEEIEAERDIPETIPVTTMWPSNEKPTPSRSDFDSMMEPKPE